MCPSRSELRTAKDEGKSRGYPAVRAVAGPIAEQTMRVRKATGYEEKQSKRDAVAAVAVAALAAAAAMEDVSGDVEVEGPAAAAAVVAADAAGVFEVAPVAAVAGGSGGAAGCVADADAGFVAVAGGSVDAGCR